MYCQISLHSQKGTKALYLVQFKPNCFVETWVHMEVFQKRLWAANLILFVVAVTLF